MAEETLIHLGFFHVRDSHGDHLKVHHVMARRGLMTLGARLRDGRGVAEFRDRPFGGGMALGAVVAEQAGVAILRLVARRAIEPLLLALELRGRRRRGTARALHEPRGESVARFIWLGGLGRHLSLANAREGDVIHFCRAGDSALVFEMTGGAGGDVGVKGGGLALEERCVVGVADDAVFRLHAFHRRMAGGAVVFEKRVRLRQLAGTDRALDRELRTRKVQEGKRRRRDSGNHEQKGEGELAHGSRLSPK